MKTLVRLSMLVALVAFGLPALSAPAQAAAPAEPRSGRVLTAGGQLTSLAGRSQVLPWTMWCDQSTFAPDGTMIATLPWDPSYGCNSSMINDSRIVIRRADGTSTRLPSLPDDVQELAWSPDQREIAAVVRNGGSEDIWIVAVDGSGSRLLYRDLDGPVAHDYGVSWSPDGARLLFAGTELSRRSYPLLPADRPFRSQLFTLPVAGGAPTPYNAPYVDPACATQADCRVLSYREPRWSPDGSKVLVTVFDSIETASQDPGADPTSQQVSVATIAEGESEPSVVRVIARATADDPVVDYRYRYYHRSFWSADGRSVVTRVIVPPAVTAGPYVRVDLQSGAETPVRTAGTEIFDWQPCPSGTCAPWKVGTTPRISMRIFYTPNLLRKVRAAGVVRPLQAARLGVEAQALRAGRWETYAIRGDNLDAKGRYQVGWRPRPRTEANRCRAVLRYRLVTTTIARFPCRR